MLKWTTLAFAILVTPAFGCDDHKSLSYQKDMARAAEKQADSMRQQERLMRERNNMLDREIRNRR